MATMMVEKSMELEKYQNRQICSSSSSISEEDKHKRCTRATTKQGMELEDVPDEILVEIFLRLPSHSIHRLQSVSKQLYHLLHNHNFATLHKFSLVPELPRLMITIQGDYHAEKRRRPISLQLLKYDATTSSFSFSRGNPTDNVVVNVFCPRDLVIVRCVFRNLFCFADQYKSRSCFLFDPLSRQVLILPSVGQPFLWFGIGMAFDDAKIKVVGISREDQKGALQLQAYIYELGTSTTSWRPITSVPPQNLSRDMGVSAFGNMFYWLKWGPGRDRIISFDFDREQFAFTPQPAALEPVGHIHLLILQGSLAISQMNTKSNHFEIWVLPQPNKDWTLNYKIQIDVCLTGPDRGRLMHCGGEWEHGLFFVEYHHRSGVQWSNAIFLDFRCGGSIKRVSFPGEFGNCRQHFDYTGRLFSFTGSIISLKQYPNLVEGEDGEWCIEEAKSSCQELVP